MKTIEIKSQIHNIEVIDSIKGGIIECVTYLADGVEVTVTGGFFIDKSGIRHHCHYFDDGVHIDVTF